MTAFSVSVVIPTYNRARFLPFAVERALSQTLPPLEVIVVDDVSTDDTPALMRSRYGAEPKVRYLRLEENQGPHFARQYGAQHGSGEFLAFLDSDDVWLPHHLEKAHQVFAENPDAVAVVSQRGKSTKRGA